MSKAKDKGRTLENLVAKHLTDAGIPTVRVPLSGSFGGIYNSDCIIGTCEHPKATIECKFRQNISKQLWDWKKNDDYLVIKRNYCEPLVVMTLDEFARLKLQDKQ